MTSLFYIVKYSAEPMDLEKIAQKGNTRKTLRGENKKENN